MKYQKESCPRLGRVVRKRFHRHKNPNSCHKTHKNLEVKR